jgi:hypothetical protein
LAIAAIHQQPRTAWREHVDRELRAFRSATRGVDARNVLLGLVEA